jgi:hypothetical protein
VQVVRHAQVRDAVLHDVVEHIPVERYTQAHTHPQSGQHAARDVASRTQRPNMTAVLTGHRHRTSFRPSPVSSPVATRRNVRTRASPQGASLGGSLPRK